MKYFFLFIFLSFFKIKATETKDNIYDNIIVNISQELEKYQTLSIDDIIINSDIISENDQQNEYFYGPKLADNENYYSKIKKFFDILN